jgi:hypothetical protein
LTVCFLPENLKIKIYDTIILPVVLYGCETLSLILREEHRVFENRVLRRIFGPKREEVAGGWRSLYNEELHNLYTSTDITWVNKSRRMRWTVHLARIEVMRNAYNNLVVKPEGKRPLGRHRRRRKDNIRIDLRKLEWEGVDRLYLNQDRDQWQALVNTVMNHRVP